MAGAGLTRQQAAERAGVDAAFVAELIDEAVLAPAADGTLTNADVRRIGIIRSLLEAGLPLEGIGRGMREGVLTLDFVDAPEYERFGGLSSETFEEASARTTVPIELLIRVHEAIGFGIARPHDRIRDDERAVIDFVELQTRLGFRPAAMERLLRAMSDSLRRVAESEAEWWRSEILNPNLEAGKPAEAVGGDRSMELSDRSETAMLAILHAQQAQTWTANIALGFQHLLASAGLHRAPQREPAICFLDITGYTRLTEERGDHAAADLADTLNRVVKRTSMNRGGRPVKWLGDGVMFHFPDPGAGALAALEMVDEIRGSGLPPAHVGLHAGPVVIQEGDYYGQTVNMAARIAEYARPGEVLVSQAVVDATTLPEVAFTDIGSIELKGVAGLVQLHACRLA